MTDRVRARIVRTWRGRRFFSKAFNVELLVSTPGGAVSVIDVMAVGWGGSAGRAKQLLEALRISHGCPSTDDFLGKEVLVEADSVPGRDYLPFVGSYSPIEEGGCPEWDRGDALDALTGDRRRRRPEVVAAAAAAAPTCTVPGCDDPAETDHCEVPRRAGGADRESNFARLCARHHRDAERRRREFEASVAPGLVVGEVVSFCVAKRGWALGLRLAETPAYRDGGVVFARSPDRVGVADVGRRLAVLLEADPLPRSGFRFRVAGAALADDDGAVDALRGRMDWPEDVS